MELLMDFIDQYAYVVLVLSLCLGILALPFPLEAIMGYTGLMAYQGKTNWLLCILAAAFGSFLGMALAYWIGHKLGMPFFERYGKRIHLGPERIEQTSKWFNRYGNKIIIIAFFIPGVRHFTGYFAGITRLNFKTFSLYSAVGSFLWVSPFILLGKMLGPNWEVFLEAIKKYLVVGGIIAAVAILIFFIFKKYKKEIILTLTLLLNNVLGFLKSRRRLHVFIAATSILTLLFLVLMIGMIQDYLGNEFHEFDVIVSMLVTLIFRTNEDTKIWMQIFAGLGSNGWLILILFITLGWIYFKGRDKTLEIYLLVITMVGGEIYDDVLRRTFHRLAPSDLTLLDRFSYDFPSGKSLMAFVIYGYLFFVLLRHTRSVGIHTMFVITWISILLFIALSRIYFGTEEPSQIAAGYVFGGVWLGVSILILEMLRMIRGIPRQS